MSVLIEFNTDNQTISARELHKNLYIETPYHKWFPRMCEYGFIEGTDFWTKFSESSGGRPASDHDITISMAKEICMIQRTPIGKQVREYLINVENAWNTPEMVMARALKFADSKIIKLTANIQELQEKIEADKPKVDFADAVDKTADGILIRDFAKLLTQNGIVMGEKKLFAWMRENGYLLRYGTSRNTPSQKASEMELFVVTEHVIDYGSFSKVSSTVRVTGKGQRYFMNKFLTDKTVNA